MGGCHHGDCFHDLYDLNSRRLGVHHSLSGGHNDFDSPSRFDLCGHYSRGYGNGYPVRSSPFTGEPTCPDCIEREMAAKLGHSLGEELACDCTEPDCNYFDDWRQGRNFDFSGGYNTRFL